MSRDRTAQEIIEDALLPIERQLRDRKIQMEILAQRAWQEGVTACLRPRPDGGFDCPFCRDIVVDLQQHFTWCQEVPEDLKGAQT